MELILNDFEKICDFSALYLAHLKACKGRSHKQGVMEFQINLAHSLSNLQESLLNKTYQMSGYSYFRVYEPKKRDIYETIHIDKIVMHVLCDKVLDFRLSPHFIYDNAACQKGKGTHFALNRFTLFLQREFRRNGQEFYVLKCDISKYFASINHDILKSLLRKKIKNTNVLDLLDHFIDSYETRDGSGTGLPLGNQTSQWFALFYMSEFDHFVKEKLGVKHYIRYMDDFVFVHHDKNYLWVVLTKIERFLWDNLGLRLNLKTAIIKVNCGVEFLGWRFFVNNRGQVVKRLKRQSMLRYYRGLSQLSARFEKNLIGFSDVMQVTASYTGHLRYGHTYRLNQRGLRLLGRRL